MKTFNIDGKEYSTPEWVNWIGRDTDGRIVGYQHKPREFHTGTGYYRAEGDSVTIYDPAVSKMLLEV